MEEFQNAIEEFFKDESDSTFLLVIKKFVYYDDINIKAVDDVFDKFVDSNGIRTAWENVKDDTVNPKDFFDKAQYSERETIKNLQICFLSIAYFRFREHLLKTIRNG